MAVVDRRTSTPSRFASPRRSEIIFGKFAVLKNHEINLHAPPALKMGDIFTCVTATCRKVSKTSNVTPYIPTGTQVAICTIQI
jgi:hypothetical protein